MKGMVDKVAQEIEVVEEEESEYELIGRAVNAAKEAYLKVFEDVGIDASYFRLNLRVERRDSTFTENLERITYEDFH